MKLIRYQNSPYYNPVSNFTSLREEMDRLFDAAFPALSSLERDNLPVERSRSFPVDLYQQKDAFVVRAELPGFRKEDLGVDVADGLLTVTAHRKTDIKADDNDSKKSATKQERRLSRAISLPEHLQLDKINAVYENGVLTVTLPKSEAVKPRQIAVDVK